MDSRHQSARKSRTLLLIILPDWSSNFTHSTDNLSYNLSTFNQMFVIIWKLFAIRTICNVYYVQTCRYICCSYNIIINNHKNQSVCSMQKSYIQVDWKFQYTFLFWLVGVSANLSSECWVQNCMFGSMYIIKCYRQTWRYTGHFIPSSFLLWTIGVCMCV